MKKLFLILLTIIISVFCASIIVERINLQRLKPIWQTKLMNSIISAPIYDQDIIYLQTETKVVALYKDTGVIIWETDVNGDLNNKNLFLLADNLYVPVSGGEIIALSREKGEKKWNSKINRMSGVRNLIDGITGGDGLIFINHYGGYIFALNIDGEEVWSNSYGLSRLPTKIIYSGGSLFITGSDRLLQIDKKNGVILETKSFGDQVVFFNIMESKGYVVTQNNNGSHLFVMDLNPFKVVWEKSFTIRDVSCIQKMGDRIIMSGLGAISINTINGSTFWNYGSSTRLGCNIRNNDELFYIGESNYLVAIDENSGVKTRNIRLFQKYIYNQTILFDPIVNEKFIIIPYFRNLLIEVSTITP